MRKLLSYLLPRSLKRRVAPMGAAGLRLSPPVGWARWGSLRRLEPISRDWGDDRGRPIDRYYIERFLEQHKEDVRGRVLDVGDNNYTKMYGGDRVSQSDVINFKPGDPVTTIVGDLANAPHVPADTFDCVVLVQTLQLIYDLRGALGTVFRVLKPGGVVLATVPGITHVCRADADSWGEHWCWSFTRLSARKLFAEHFGDANVTVEGFGNVVASVGFLHGLAAGELTERELNHRDRDYEMLLTVRAQKPLERAQGQA